MSVFDRLWSWLRDDEQRSENASPDDTRHVDGASGSDDAARYCDGRLLLLTKFIAAADTCDFEADRWAEVLGEPSRVAIRRLRTEGLLVPASLADALAAVHQSRDLKDLARGRGLKVSGTKAELSRRLADCDPEGMKSVLGEREVLVCSPEGRAAADQWKARATAARDAVQTQVLELVRARRFADALRAVARFESTQVFSRGLGITWENSDDLGGLAPQLAAIFAGAPKILSRASAEEIETLRVAAAASLLWGDRSEERWLPQGFVSTCGFNNDVAVRMFVFYAKHVCELERMKGLVRTVKLSPVNDHVTCDACRALHGRTFELRRAPELPHASCTSPMGCRCLALPEETGV